MIISLVVAVMLANIRQPYPAIAPLQHLPTLVLILTSPMLLRRWPISNASVRCVLAFLLLHTLAGRYTYSNVPYDAWGRALTGLSIDEILGLKRNDFDRLVHFSFGLLWVRPLAEIACLHAGLKPSNALVQAVLIVGMVSALYEIFEWLLTILLAPQIAADYNGQQGDVWDSQKDMAVAILGALLASFMMLFSRQRVPN